MSTLKAMRFSLLSCGLRSLWRHTQENSFTIVDPAFQTLMLLTRQSHDNHTKTLTSSQGQQISLNIITIQFCAAEDNSLVHLVGSNSFHEILGL